MALFIWLIPLIGWPSPPCGPRPTLRRETTSAFPRRLAFEQLCRRVPEQPIGWYILNSFKVTIPTVIGAVALSCLTGFALAVYGFRANLWVFFAFVAGQLHPLPDPDGPGPRPDAAAGLYDTTLGLVLFHVAFQTGFCTSSCAISSRACPLP